MNVFDRSLVRRHRARAAARFDQHDFLVREVAERLADRLDDIRRRFPLALDLGCHGGQLGRAINGRGGIETLIQSDCSPELLARAPGLRLVADEELLPFAKGRFDIVLSSLSLHWINDLPGALAQIRTVLKPDGLFLAAMLGGDTLFELRASMLEAEIEISGGAGPRLSPMADIRDAGGLLVRAGFAMPVTDSDTITVTYPDALALMQDLRGMAETNAVVERPRSPAKRELMARTAAIYRSRFGDAAGRIPATFQVLYLTGWGPEPMTQPRPLSPGQAGKRLADALDTEERSAGGKTPRPKS